MHYAQFNRLRDLLTVITDVENARQIGFALLDAIKVSGMIDHGCLDAEVLEILEEKGHVDSTQPHLKYLGKIAAIKHYRARTGVTLREAKEYVENIIWKLENGKFSSKSKTKKTIKSKSKAKKGRLRHRPCPKGKKRRKLA